MSFRENKVFYTLLAISAFIRNGVINFLQCLATGVFSAIFTVISIIGLGWLAVKVLS